LVIFVMRRRRLSTRPTAPTNRVLRAVIRCSRTVAVAGVSHGRRLWTMRPDAHNFTPASSTIWHPHRWYPMVHVNRM
jgi:hypothetical protein